MTRGPRWELSTGRTLIIGEFQKETRSWLTWMLTFVICVWQDAGNFILKGTLLCRAKALRERERGKKEAFSSPLWPETDV